MPGLEVCHALLLEGVFVAHGDQVDLRYAFALLEGRFGLRRSSALALYRGLIAAPDWAARAAHTLVIGHPHPVPHVDAQVGGQRLVIAPA